MTINKGLVVPQTHDRQFHEPLQRARPPKFAFGNQPPSGYKASDIPSTSVLTGKSVTRELTIAA